MHSFRLYNRSSLSITVAAPSRTILESFRSPFSLTRSDIGYENSGWEVFSDRYSRTCRNSPSTSLADRQLVSSFACSKSHRTFSVCANCFVLSYASLKLVLLQRISTTRDPEDLLHILCSNWHQTQQSLHYQCRHRCRNWYKPRRIRKRIPDLAIKYAEQHFVHVFNKRHPIHLEPCKLSNLRTYYDDIVVERISPLKCSPYSLPQVLSFRPVFVARCHRKGTWK